MRKLSTLAVRRGRSRRIRCIVSFYGSMGSLAWLDILPVTLGLNKKLYLYPSRFSCTSEHAEVLYIVFSSRIGAQVVCSAGWVRMMYIVASRLQDRRPFVTAGFEREIAKMFNSMVTQTKRTLNIA